MKHRRFKAGRFALSGLALATACLWGLQAHAVGLGRLTVQSALGEPLRAEIDVTSLTPEEAATLQLRVASPDAYKAAGVDYNAVLPATQLQLVRQPDGRAVIRVTSSRAVVEPFVDVIVEMNWASGKLVREVTMLFDPPTTRMAAPAAPATAPVMSAAPPAAPVRPRPAQRAAPRPEAPAPVTAAAPAAPATAPAATTPTTPTGTTDQYRVVSGDTLSRIAQKVQRPSVSLDQMLVALFRDNPEAFIGRNMNRLKAGEVLTVPSAEAALQISRDQARDVIQAQSADFDAYRRQLASGVAAASTEAPGRHAKGSVQAMVQDSKQPAVAPADKLTLSQGAVKATAPEAAASADAERKDSATRAAELSRNVEDLKQLQAATAQASAPATAAVAAAATTAAAATASASAATVEAAAATPPVAVVTAAASTAAPPARATVAKTPAPQAASREPGAFDSLLDNPLLLPGAGVLLALLAGLGVYRLRSRARASERETSFLESRLQPDSFFGASGGQRVDTHDSPSVASSSAASSMSYSLSQLDAIGDVDPVAEADVYLAYGRDLQAEEILKEAMRANPDRLPIRTKLLEVYAKRRDTKGYELLAGQLFALAGADSDDWKKAQELGRQIDPSNPLYAPGGQPNLIVREGGRIVEPLDATTMPRSVMPTPSEIASSQPVPLEVASGLDLDLDLNLGAKGPAETTPGALEATRPFTTGASMVEPVPAAAERAPSSAADKSGTLDALDFDLGELALDAPVGAASGKPTRDEFGASLPAFDLAEEDGDALSRKLELAEEFRQIGDLEGARDLLEEVIAQSDGTLKSKAQGMLASLT